MCEEKSASLLYYVYVCVGGRDVVSFFSVFAAQSVRVRAGPIVKICLQTFVKLEKKNRNVFREVRFLSPH